MTRRIESAQDLEFIPPQESFPSPRDWRDQFIYFLMVDRFDDNADGVNFAYPHSGQCTLAFSRILDTDEVLIAMNLEASPRQDRITVDRNLTLPWSEVVDLLNGGARLPVEEAGGRAYVRVPLGGHQMAILKRTAS